MAVLQDQDRIGQQELHCLSDIKTSTIASMPIKQSINRSIDQNKPRNKQTDIVTYNHRMKEQHNFLIQESSEMYGFKIGIFFYDWNKLV